MESPLFARAFDLARETLRTVERLPRHRRAVLGRRLEESAMDFHAALLHAGTSGAFDDATSAADRALATHGFAMRLCVSEGLVTVARFGEISRLSAECGRLLGGWIKAERRKARSGPTRGGMEQHTRQPARIEPQQKRPDEQE